VIPIAIAQQVEKSVVKGFIFLASFFAPQTYVTAETEDDHVYS
jgi:hypothetical protein